MKDKICYIGPNCKNELGRFILREKNKAGTSCMHPYQTPSCTPSFQILFSGRHSPTPFLENFFRKRCWSV